MKMPWGSVEPGALESILERDLEFAQVTVPLSVTWVSVKRVAGVGGSLQAALKYKFMDLVLKEGFAFVFADVRVLVTEYPGEQLKGSR